MRAIVSGSKGLAVRTALIKCPILTWDMSMDMMAMDLDVMVMIGVTAKSWLWSEEDSVLEVEF